MHLYPRHILVKILSSFLLLSFLPLALMNVLWSGRSTKLLTENALNSVSQVLNQASLSIDNSMNALTTVALSVMFDNELLTILNAAPKSEEVEQERRETIRSKLKQAKNINNIIADVTLVSAFYKLSSNDGAVDYECLVSSPWYTGFLESGALKAYTGFRVAEYLPRANVPSFAILRRINSRESRQVGTLVIELRAEYFTHILKEMRSEQLASAVVYNESGEMIYQSEDLQEQHMENLRDILLASTGSTVNIAIDDKPFIVASVRQTQIDWIVFGLISQDVLFARIHSMQRAMNVTLALMLAVVVIAAVWLSAQVVHPISQLSKATRRIRDGDLSVSIPVTTKDEIGRLGDDFNDMVLHMRQLLREVAENERHSREVEMKALQAQINPHFLYNTLNSIRWMAAMHGMDTISDMILSLTRLLEFSGKTTADYVPVRTELEHVNHYLRLMDLRYNHAFQVKRSIDPSVMEAWTLKFTLQPLVENAIFHGIEPQEQGTIFLTVERRDDSLYFEVADDGIGMRLEHQERRTFSGLGIDNVNERLRLHFGDKAQLHISSEPGQGTCVTFSVPLLEQDPNRKGERDIP